MNKIRSEYKCKLCNKNYKTLSGLWKHNRKFHYDIKNNLKHGQSEIKFGNRKYKLCEIEEENVGNYKCKYCNKNFKYSQGISV